MILYQSLKQLIQRGQTEGLMDKLDIFFAADKLTAEQYNELIQMLSQ